MIVIEYDEETDTVKCIEVYPNPDHAKEGNIENTTLEEIEDWSPGPIYFVNVTGATSDQREDAVDFAEQQLKEKEGFDWNSILWLVGAYLVTLENKLTGMDSIARKLYGQLTNKQV